MEGRVSWSAVKSKEARKQKQEGMRGSEERRVDKGKREGKSSSHPVIILQAEGEVFLGRGWSQRDD